MTMYAYACVYVYVCGYIHKRDDTMLFCLLKTLLPKRSLEQGVRVM
jgi:hypothetical protein